MEYQYYQQTDVQFSFTVLQTLDQLRRGELPDLVPLGWGVVGVLSGVLVLLADRCPVLILSSQDTGPVPPVEER